MQHTMRRTTHRQIRWDNIMLLALSVIFCITLLVAVMSWNGTPKVVGSQPYIVQDGDTLWNIAKMSNGNNNIDIRDIIEDIKKLSNCTSDIVVGDVIQIPIYEEV